MNGIFQVNTRFEDKGSSAGKGENCKGKIQEQGHARSLERNCVVTEQTWMTAQEAGRIMKGHARPTRESPWKQPRSP